jgi:hypothetical protein
MQSLSCSQEGEILAVAKRDKAFKGLTDDQILRHIVAIKDHGEVLTVRLQRGVDVLNVSVVTSNMLVS